MMAGDGVEVEWLWWRWGNGGGSGWCEADWDGTRRPGVSTTATTREEVGKEATGKEESGDGHARARRSATGGVTGGDGDSWPEAGKARSQREVAGGRHGAGDATGGDGGRCDVTRCGRRVAEAGTACGG